MEDATTSKWGPSCCLVLKLVFITKQQGAPCTHFLGASNSESKLTIVGLKKKSITSRLVFFFYLSLSLSFSLSHLIGELGKQKLQKFLETLFWINWKRKENCFISVSFKKKFVEFIVPSIQEVPSMEFFFYWKFSS